LKQGNFWVEQGIQNQNQGIGLPEQAIPPAARGVNSLALGNWTINVLPWLVGIEACVDAQRLGSKLTALGHHTRLMPAKYVRPASK
jgi:transposase